jgi:hypothetical protein
VDNAIFEMQTAYLDRLEDHIHLGFRAK